jgi:hypothetical protein
MARRLTELFVFVFRDGLRQLAADRRCVGEDYRVFLHLVGCLEWDNWVRVSQMQVAQELGMSRQSVWRALRRMVQYEILLPGPKLGHLPTYRLSPKVCYFGPLARRRMERRQAAARQRLVDLSEALAEGEAFDVTQVTREGKQGQPVVVDPAVVYGYSC